jgi:hypothetical protein
MNAQPERSAVPVGATDDRSDGPGVDVLRNVETMLSEHAGAASPVEALMIARATAGDREAAADAARAITQAIEDGAPLSPELALYLARNPKRSRGRPTGPADGWRHRLAALDALLALDGIGTNKRNADLADARSVAYPSMKTLDDREVRKLREEYAPMRDGGDTRQVRRLLRSIAGPALVQWLHDRGKQQGE